MQISYITICRFYMNYRGSCTIARSQKVYLTGSMLNLRSVRRNGSS